MDLINSNIYKNKAWSHHEYDVKNNNTETHDSSYLLNDIDISKLPIGWGVVKIFKENLENKALQNCILEIDSDLKRFGVFFDPKATTVLKLSLIVGVDLFDVYDLYIDDDTKYLGFFFDDNSELLYIRKGVNVLKLSKEEHNLSQDDYIKELKKVCSKFDISDIPELEYVQGHILPPCYTFELHKNGVFKNLQFEIFTNRQYHKLKPYYTEKVKNFISSIEYEQDYPIITHFKIDYIENKWELVKIYFLGFENQCEFLKDGEFQQEVKFINDELIVESLQDKMKRMIFS